MILLLNTFFFYSFTTSYFTWFKNCKSEYMAYINSTISSILVLSSEKFINPVISSEFLSGFLLHDIGHVLLNIETYKKHKMYLQYIFHHVLTLSICLSSYPELYPDLTSQLLSLETTIPFINIIWFLRYHNVGLDYLPFFKFLYFCIFSYYRVYKLLYMTFITNDNYDLFMQSFITLLSGVNILWYAGMVNRNICKYM